MGMFRAFAAATSLVLAACSGSGNDGGARALTVPTFPPQPGLEPGVFAIQGAMASGVFAVREGCVGFVSDNSGRFLVIQWPEGTTSTPEEVRYGDHAMRPGDRVTLGGGTGDDPRDPDLQRCLDVTGTTEAWIGVATPDD